MQEFHSKVGYSFSYKKKESLCFLAAYFVIAVALYLFFPAPANQILATIFSGLFLFFLVIGVALMKWVLGVTVRIEGNSIRIHSTQAFTLNPKDNQLYFTQKASGACVLTKENIVSAQPLKTEEIRELQKLWNVHTYAGTNIIQFLVNVPTMQRLAFVTDWKNIVVLHLAHLDVWDPKISDLNAMRKEKDYRLLVSVGNSDEFCRLLSGRHS